MELFDVHVLGFDVSEERATRSLMQVFGLSEAAARIFVHSVPRIGKRRVPKDTAERYIRALHAVGAVVECRVSTPSSAEPSAGTSLPAPTVSKFPGVAPHIMQDSFGVMAPTHFSPHMPQIPKAPRIPADLTAIRNRKGPDSLAPHWKPTGPGGDARRGQSFGAPLSAWDGKNHDHDSELDSPSPDALFISSAGAGPAAGGAVAARGGAGSPHAVAMGDPSLGPVIAARAAEGAVFDSDGRMSSPRPSSMPPVDPDTAWYARPTYQLLLALAIIGSMTVAASSGIFETNASRLGRAFAEAGIQAGQYDRAATFLAAGDTQFEGTTKENARVLLDELLKAGAVDAWAINIHRRAGLRTSGVLLVELPEAAAKRRAIFAAHARLAKPVGGAIKDEGQRFAALKVGE